MKKYILYITLLFASSCGSRKSQVDKTETEKNVEAIKTEQKDVITVSEIDTHIINETDDFIITPVDNEKEVVVIYPNKDTLKLRNAKFERKKAVVNITQKEQVQQTDKSETKDIKKEQVKQSTKNKATERKSSYSWLWWLILLLPIYFAIRYVYQKFRV